MDTIDVDELLAKKQSLQETATTTMANHMQGAIQEDTSYPAEDNSDHQKVFKLALDSARSNSSA
jgi:hypothetical protein